MYAKITGSNTYVKNLQPDNIRFHDLACSNQPRAFGSNIINLNVKRT